MQWKQEPIAAALWGNKMCGIAGVLGQKQAALAVEAMLKGIAHRGPNGQGVYALSDEAAIGMCRLRVRSAIEDTVPFRLAAGGYASYNGEIYGSINAVGEPSVEAPRGGRGEVEALLACDADERPDGMYALAVADTSSLVIKRDPYGIKPLFYRQAGASLAFCSEPQPLRQGQSAVFNRDALDDLLIFGHMLNHQTIDRSIQQLAFDTEIHYQQGQYAFVNMPPVAYPHTHMPEVQALIAHSVRKCMLADQPVGLSVSSGLDSRILAHELNTQGYDNLKTVSIVVEGVEDDGITQLADLALSGVKTWQQWEHFDTLFRAADFPEYLQRSVRCLGQPTRMTSFPLYMKLAELTHQAGLTVLLSGEGADEIFHGYSEYLTFQVGDLEALEAAILRFYVKESDLPVLNALLGPERVAQSIARFQKMIAPLLDKHQPRRSLLRVEQALRLPALLERTDLCLMQYSIEGRVPYLHGGIPEQMSAVPEHALHQAGVSKPLLRAAYAGVLPTAHIPKKRFRMPIQTWLAGECRDWALDLIQTQNNGLQEAGINPEVLEQWLAAPSAPVTTFTFTLLSYILWHQQERIRTR
jgi:asparagine synthase (glutamine-hydrolysing)